MPKHFSEGTAEKLCKQMGIDLIHVDQSNEIDEHLAPLGLPNHLSRCNPRGNIIQHNIINS
jgi:hypothetical protein